MADILFTVAYSANKIDHNSITVVDYQSIAPNNQSKLVNIQLMQLSHTLPACHLKPIVHDIEPILCHRKARFHDNGLKKNHFTRFAIDLNRVATDSRTV